MTQAELIHELSYRADTTQATVTAVIEALGNMLGELRPGESVRHGALGTFEVNRRLARKGRNPRTGAEIEIAATNTIKLTSAIALRRALNQPQPAARKRA